MTPPELTGPLNSWTALWPIFWTASYLHTKFPQPLSKKRVYGLLSMLIIYKIEIELLLVSSWIVDRCVFWMFLLFDAVWNDSFIPFENSSRSALLKIHFVRYVSNNALLSWLFLFSSHVKTCFLTEYFCWDGCWHISSPWHFLSLCLTWSCLAPGYKHCIHRTLLMIRVKRSLRNLGKRSIEFFGPFVGTWPTLLLILHFTWVLELWQCDLDRLSFLSSLSFCDFVSLLIKQCCCWTCSSFSGNWMSFWHYFSSLRSSSLIFMNHFVTLFSPTNW